MFQFFKVNDPFRLVVVLLFLLALRLPILLQADKYQLLLPELEWMLLGEALSEGRMLYADVWKEIPPLSALLYGVIENFADRNPLVYGLISTALIFVQAIIFNTLLLRRDFLLDRSYIPAMLYVFMASLTVDYLTLPPLLFGLTFLLVVIYKVFTLSENTHDQTLFSIGFYLGVASLFYLSYTLFLFWVIIGLGIFRSTTFRQHLLVVFGWLFPILIVGMYFFWNESFFAFLAQAGSSVSFVPKLYFSAKDYFLILVFPTLFLLMGIINMFSARRLTNYQSYCRQMMFFWVIISALTLFLCIYWLPHQLIVFVPAVSFFGTYYLFSIKRKWITELTFLCVLAGSVVQLWSTFITLIEPIDYAEAIAQKPKNFDAKNKKIWVLGDNVAYYIDNKVATPFLDWTLAESALENTSDYESVTSLYEQISSTPPEIIIDQEGTINELFKKLPLFALQYEKVDENTYRLNSN